MSSYLVRKGVGSNPTLVTLFLLFFFSVGKDKCYATNITYSFGQALNAEFAMISAPSPASSTFRAELAKLVSPLKRIRPRVPFRKLAAHRIPTLSLYRGLLRNATTEDVCILGLKVGALVDVPFVKPRFGSEYGCCSERTCI